MSSNDDGLDLLKEELRFNRERNRGVIMLTCAKLEDNIKKLGVRLDILFENLNKKKKYSLLLNAKASSEHDKTFYPLLMEWSKTFRTEVEMCISRAVDRFKLYLLEIMDEYNSHIKKVFSQDFEFEKFLDEQGLEIMAIADDKTFRIRKDDKNIQTELPELEMVVYQDYDFVPPPENLFSPYRLFDPRKTVRDTSEGRFEERFQLDVFEAHNVGFIYSILPISYSTGYIGTSSKGVMKYFIEKSPGKNNKDSARFEPYSNKGGLVYDLITDNQSNLYYTSFETCRVYRVNSHNDEELEISAFLKLDSEEFIGHTLHVSTQKDILYVRKSNSTVEIHKVGRGFCQENFEPEAIYMRGKIVKMLNFEQYLLVLIQSGILLVYDPYTSTKILRAEVDLKIEIINEFVTTGCISFDHNYLAIGTAVFRPEKKFLTRLRVYRMHWYDSVEMLDRYESEIADYERNMFYGSIHMGVSVNNMPMVVSTFYGYPYIFLSLLLKPNNKLSVFTRKEFLHRGKVTSMKGFIDDIWTCSKDCSISRIFLHDDFD